MDKIDWKRKLSSRKFWAMIAGFITGLIVYIQSPEKSPEAIGALVMILGSIVAYIIGEGLADHINDNSTTNYNSPHIFDYPESEENDNGVSET